MVINMEELTPKKVSESKTEQIQILMPQHINGYKRLFGGVLMEWIDVVAGVVARRHANSEVTTASVDNLQFKSPAYVNSTIILSGKSPMSAQLQWKYGSKPLLNPFPENENWSTARMLSWLP